MFNHNYEHQTLFKTIDTDIQVSVFIINNMEMACDWKYYTITKNTKNKDLIDVFYFLLWQIHRNFYVYNYFSRVTQKI